MEADRLVGLEGTLAFSVMVEFSGEDDEFPELPQPKIRINNKLQIIPEEAKKTFLFIP